MRSKKIRTARIVMAGLVVAGVSGAGFAAVAAARTEQAAPLRETAKTEQITASRQAQPASGATKSKFVFQNQRPAAVPGRTDVTPRGTKDTLHSSLRVEPAPGGPELSSSFPTTKVHTVVFTRGTKAWYAAVQHRDGWTSATVKLKGESYTGEAAGPTNPSTFGFGVFAYDRSGRLLQQFPGKVADPLGKGPVKSPPGFTVSTTVG
ncbi:hypothetical protein FB561_3696 [Kribbella amoyensis]|uniref:Uncharacterized protein n=1 Tax=Kribbella amoyensis TaxID=996641 RepID=A0A561BUT9_9ACTN|nr:hypothetical protein [Kribbella amoyensis]TWD82563.1 hypothetical protein FB561_3696 [Kribbella amoyensis]